MMDSSTRTATCQGSNVRDKTNREEVSPRRTILFVTNSGSFGGAEQHLLDLLVGLGGAHRSTVICLRNDNFSSRLAAYPELPVQVENFPVNAGFRQWRHMFRERLPDVVVFVHPDISVFPWFAYLAARLARIGRICSIHHITPDEVPDALPGLKVFRPIRRVVGWNARSRYEIRFIAMLTDLAICVSEAVRDDLLGKYGFSDARTITVLNGVNRTRYTPLPALRGEMRDRLGLSPADVLAVGAGRLVPHKGYHLLLEAVARVRARHPELKCVIVGDGAERANLEALSQRLALGSAACLAGFQPDVVPYLQAADFFVLPSSREGLPLSALEAMACGVPCVLTRVSGNPEIVEDGENGLLVPVGSIGALADAITRMVADPSARERMAAAALDTVARRFDISMTTRKLEAAILGYLLRRSVTKVSEERG